MQRRTNEVRTMKKTRAQIDTIKDSGVKFPLLWKVVGENKRFLQIKNRITGEHRVIRK